MSKSNPYAWQEVVQRVRNTWGRTGSEAWDKAELLYRRNSRIQTLPQEAVMKAVGSYEHEGAKWAPRIPEVLTRASAAQQGSVERIDEGECGHERTAVCGSVEICVLCLSEWQIEGVEIS